MKSTKENHRKKIGGLFFAAKRNFVIYPDIRATGSLFPF